MHLYVDIEKDVDEKGAARVLEQSTLAISNLSCVFTVVPNAFTGLEFSESTCFDLIFVSKELQHLTAFDFLRILRNVGSPVDVVLLIESHDSMTEEMARANGFCTLLKKEYQTIQLCNIISDVAASRYGLHQSASLHGTGAISYTTNNGPHSQEGNTYKQYDQPQTNYNDYVYQQHYGKCLCISCTSNILSINYYSNT